MQSAYKITDIRAREILDSRGNPTLEVTVEYGGASGTFAVPSGASTGTYEAWEKRDEDRKRFHGAGVKNAAKAIETKILKSLKNKDVRDQKKIDSTLIKLDGTANKKNLGGNALLGVSIACAKAAANATNKPLHAYLKTLAKIRPSRNVPYLYMNLINAGKHASSYLAFQEYMIVPMVNDIESALVIADRIKSELKKEVIKKYGPFSANYGDEGGIVIQAKKVREPLEMLTKIIGKLGLRGKVKLAIDAAASSFYQNGPGPWPVRRAGKYEIDGKMLNADQLLNLYKGLVKDFDFLSIEDPFAEDDFESFSKLLSESGLPGQGKVKIIGDDLTVTNPGRLKTAIEKRSINGIIIKPNQIGTLTETLDVMKSARENNIECIVSHRSGETSDDFIADLAYAFGAFGLKAGASNRGERVAKYNRLWEISS
jgi:enolase